MIYSVSKQTKKLVPAGLPVRRGDTIFRECSADQQATPDPKTSGTFFFWALACDKCSCQTPARAAAKGTLDPTTPGRSCLPAPLFPTHSAACQQDLWIGISSPQPRDTTYNKLEQHCNSHEEKASLPPFLSPHLFLKAGEELTGAWEHKKWAGV